MNSTDPFPHKREPIPPIRLYAIDYALIITVGALIGAWLTIALSM